MQDLLFYIFAALTLLFGVLVVANPFSRSPVTSAMFLVMTMGALAGLFVTLHAFFIAAVQILVYAGAVMVLFLFVIMLLDLMEEERDKQPGQRAHRHDEKHRARHRAAAERIGHDQDAEEQRQRGEDVE